MYVLQENGNESSNITAVDTPAAPAATGWGGKTSFANVRRKNLWCNACVYCSVTRDENLNLTVIQLCDE